MQATVDTIQADLAQVRVDAKEVLDLNTQQLQDAWSEYGEAIRDIPDTTPPTEILNAVKQHTQTLDHHRQGHDRRPGLLILLGARAECPRGP